jgi:hypothetical protein
VLYINWMRETAERRLYVLRDQLKTQYKQTQKAQISERKSSDSKRRLTSYIFHVSPRRGEEVWEKGRKRGADALGGGRKCVCR